MVIQPFEDLASMPQPGRINERLACQDQCESHLTTESDSDKGRRADEGTS